MKFKKLLVLLLAMAMMAMPLAACGSPEAEAPEVEAPVESTVVADAAMAYFADLPESNNMIVTEDLFAKIDAGEEMFIMDVRSAEDYALGHLKGAVNMPFASTAIADNLEFIPDDVPVYVNCYTGQTASQVTSILKSVGKNILNIRGGWLRGIATTAGFENYTDTAAVEMPTDEVGCFVSLCRLQYTLYMQLLSPLFLAAHFAPGSFVTAMLNTLSSEDMTSLRDDHYLLGRVLTDVIQFADTDVFVWLLDTLRIDLNMRVVCLIVHSRV